MTPPRLGLWWGFAVVLAAGLGVSMLGGLRPGGFLMAAALAAAGVLRLVLPRRAVGGLQVRSRAFDVVGYLGLAAGLAVLVSVVDLTPVR